MPVRLGPFPGEIKLPILKSKEFGSQSPEPDIRVKTAWKFSFAWKTRQNFGILFWNADKNLGSSRADLVRVTRCVSKCVIRSTAPIYRPNEIRLKPVLDFS